MAEALVVDSHRDVQRQAIVLRDIQPVAATERLEARHVAWLGIALHALNVHDRAAIFGDKAVFAAHRIIGAGYKSADPADGPVAFEPFIKQVVVEQFNRGGG